MCSLVSLAHLPELMKISVVADCHYSAVLIVNHLVKNYFE